MKAGLCECGCGQTTNKIKQTCTAIGAIKGEYRRYVRGHRNKGKMLADSTGWKGGVKTDSNGYKMVMRRGYSGSHKSGYALEHRVIAEKALGRHLPLNIEIHHVGSNRADNTTLVICENHEYHHLLHMRQDAYYNSGDANKRKCTFCQKYDAIENMYNKKTTRGWNTYHNECKNQYDRDRRKRKSTIDQVAIAAA